MATRTKPLETLRDVKSLTPVKNNTKVIGNEKVGHALKKVESEPKIVKPDYTTMNATARNAAIHEKSVDVIRQLRAIGLQAVAYDRAPVGPLVFTMGLDANAEVYRFWTGSADVVVIDAVQEPKAQAVIRVKEDAHTVKMDVQRLAWYSLHQPPTGAMLSPIVFPDKTVLTVKNGEWLDPKPGTKQTAHRRVYKAQLIAKVPKFDNYYLIGYDENKCFISQLPKPVKTVKEAIASLKPAGLVHGHVRQGEWFFNPCSKAEIATIEKHIKSIRSPRNERRWGGDDFTYEWANGKCKRNADYTRDIAPYARLETGSSHSAQFYVEYGGTKYVKGEIFDRRLGRHAPLQLENWHRVVRNNEVAQTQTSQARPARRWD